MTEAVPPNESAKVTEEMSRTLEQHIEGEGIETVQPNENAEETKGTSRNTEQHNAEDLSCMESPNG